MTALQKLFNSDAPKKGAVSTPREPKPVPAASTPKDTKEPEPPKASEPKASTPKKAKKETPPKSEGRKKGLESDHWHGKAASFPQTSRLKKETGLKTWDLDTPLTRLQAATMISTIEDDGKAGVEAVTVILTERFGCEVYVRPGAKVKAAPKADDQPDPDDLNAILANMQEELAQLKASNRALKSANTRMSKAS